MRRRQRKAWSVAAALTVVVALFLVPTLVGRPWSIDHYYMRVFAEFAFRHPMLLTGIGILEGTPFRGPDGELDDFSPRAEEKETRWIDRQLATLHGYSTGRMTEDQKLSYQVLDEFLTEQQRVRRFAFHDYPVNQLSGIQTTLPTFMTATHPLKSRADAERYIRRVSRFGVALDQVIEGMRVRRSIGVVPPRFVLRESIEQMRRFVGTSVAANPLVQSFAARIDTVRGLSAEERSELRQRLEREVRRTVVPAYQRLIASCTDLERDATDEDGVWKLPDGDAYYAECLRSHTTTDLPADTIHALGLREVDRLEGEIRGVLRSMGEPSADIGLSLARLGRDPRNHYPAGDSSRAAILSDYQRLIDDASQRVAPLFHLRPKASVRVERVPAYEEATAPAASYVPGSIDGSRAGIFYVNLRDPRELKRSDMRTLAYHEAIPGHHYQIAIAQELRGVPFFRRIVPFTAYDEGWALYTERLALERGFQRDALDSLGALQMELFRAVRLVVDTGIHRKRWTRERAIEYMEQTTGMPHAEVVTEIERYIVDPGQACAYKVGQLEILALRQRAMDRLGSRFDLRAFHDVVLGHGALPLVLLERVVDRWIESEGRGVASRSTG